MKNTVKPFAEPLPNQQKSDHHLNDHPHRPRSTRSPPQTNFDPFSSNTTIKPKTNPQLPHLIIARLLTHTDVTNQRSPHTKSHHTPRGVTSQSARDRPQIVPQLLPQHLRSGTCPLLHPPKPGSTTAAHRILINGFSTSHTHSKSRQRKRC